MPASLRAWFQSIRPLAHLNVAPYLLIGHLSACVTAGVSPEWMLWPTLIWGALAHLTIVWSNELSDYATDTGPRTLVAGGSGVVRSGALSPIDLRIALRYARALMVLIAVWLAIRHGRSMAIVYTCVTWLGTWLYDRAPFRLAHRGGGHWLQAFGLGFIFPSFASDVIRETPVSLAVAAPLCAFAMSSYILTAFPDEESDTFANKRTFVVVHGASIARAFATLLLLVGAFGVWRNTTGTSASLLAFVAVGIAAVTFSLIIRRARSTYSVSMMALITLMQAMWIVEMWTVVASL